MERLVDSYRDEQPSEMRGFTRLTLIRHADTDDSDALSRDPSTSELGDWQASQLAERLSRTGELRCATQLLASDLARCRSTAAFLQPALGAEGLDPQFERSLREMSWGEAEGLSWQAMVKRYGEPSGKDRPFAPGAESWSTFEQRARSALRSCAQRFPGETSVLICHTGIIEASFIEFGGLHRRSLRFAMAPRNASITTWIGLMGREASRWRLEVYNDAAHLLDNGVLRHRTEDIASPMPGGEPFWEAMEPGKT